ncbi:MAG: HepT-like ribonuclease domain-containing protein [Caldilinea sp.]
MFPKLAESDVLPEALAERLVVMAKFRNVLVHLYLEIETERTLSIYPTQPR